MSSGPPGRSPYHRVTRSRQSQIESQRGSSHTSTGIPSSSTVSAPISDSLTDPPRTTSAAIMNMNMNLTARFDDVLESSQSPSFTGPLFHSNTSIYSAGGNTTSFYNSNPTTILNPPSNSNTSSLDYNPYALPYDMSTNLSPSNNNMSWLGNPPAITGSRYSTGSTGSTGSGPLSQHSHQPHVHFAPHINTRRSTMLDKSHGSSMHPSSTKSMAGGSFSFSHPTSQNQSFYMQSIVDHNTSPSSFALRSQRYSLGSTNSNTSVLDESKDHGMVMGSSSTSSVFPGATSKSTNGFKNQTQGPTTKEDEEETNDTNHRNGKINYPQPVSKDHTQMQQPHEPMIMNLRNLVTSCLQSLSTTYSSTASMPFAAFSSSISSPASMSVFYASMLYTKTQSLEDAYLYAQALVSNDEKKRAIWILDKAGLLTCGPYSSLPFDSSDDFSSSWMTQNNKSLQSTGQPYPKYNKKALVRLRMDSVLLAASCLSSTGEWEEALLLLEEVFRYPQPEQCRRVISTTMDWDPGRRTNQITQDDDHDVLLPLPQHPSETFIESGDDPRILLLAKYIHDGSMSISNSNNTVDMIMSIHPMARLCTLRGICYDEMSNPTRAASFLVAALTIDSKCVQAWNYLCTRHLLSPMEEKEILTSTLNFDPPMEWLRDVYLARLSVPRTDCFLDAKDHSNMNDEETMASFPLQSTNLFDQGDGQFVETMMRSQHPTVYISSPNRSSFKTKHHELDMINESTIYLQATPSDILSPSKVNTSLFGNMNLSVTLDKMHHNEKLQNDATDDVFEKIRVQYGLSLAPEVLALAAIRAYDSYNLPSALLFCKALSDVDPLCSTAAHVHIATLTGLRQKRPLFRLAHMLVEADPKSAMAWYAVGCYYQMCGKYDLAQKHFCRATRLNPRSAECWIAFGCSFAARDESDQALASFRAAQRLHTGNHYPMLYMGMEYIRTNHLSLAGHFLKSARMMGPDDPLCYHELGVLSYRKSAWDEAAGWFLLALRIYTERIALANDGISYDGYDKVYDKDNVSTVCLSNLECLERCHDVFWEPTIFNLGQCYRKAKRFREALACFENCASLCPVRIFHSYIEWSFFTFIFFLNYICCFKIEQIFGILSFGIYSTFNG